MSPLHGDSHVHAHSVCRSARRRRHRPHRGAVRRRGDEPHRRAPRAARDPQPVLADAPGQPGDEGRAVRSVPGMRRGRHHDQEPVPPGVEPRRDRAGVRPAARRGRGPHRRGRRSLRHAAHLQGHREAPADRHGALRRALRHPRRLPRIEVPSRRTVSPGGRGGPARPAPDHPDRDSWRRGRHRRLEVQSRHRHARGLHGGAVRAAPPT